MFSQLSKLTSIPILFGAFWWPEVLHAAEWSNWDAGRLIDQLYLPTSVVDNTKE